MTVPAYNYPQPPEGYIPLLTAAQRTGYTPQGLGLWARQFPELVLRLDGRWFFHAERLDAFIATRKPPKARRAVHAQG